MAPVSLYLLLALQLVLLRMHGTAIAARSGCTKTCDLFSQECLDEECVCKRDCSSEAQLRVCTKRGFQYQSRCHFFRDQCLCKSRSSGCRNPGVEKDYIRMYSACPRSAGLARGTPAQSAALVMSYAACQDYSNRLAAWLSYALTLKLSESMVSLHEFETDEYTNGMYTNELLVFAPLSSAARRLVETLRFYTLDSLLFDPRLPSVWFCLLDADTDGWLEEKELAQLTRVLLPRDICIEAFLAGCLRGGRAVGLAAWQGPHCFRLSDGDIKSSCDLG